MTGSPDQTIPNAFISRFLAEGHDPRTKTRSDVIWLIGFSLLLVATGIGLRDPWPADEPRFALVVRDMVATGDWLLPRVGGDIYADKPPLYFWIMAVFLELTGSLRAAFLIPSLLATVGSVLLIYDLVRRLWNRETGLVGGFALLLTLQFVWQGRQAQIDALLCFWIVLSLYGLLRHLLAGPAWGYYALGCAAAGLGVITKGVGFLPLLILVPYAVLRSRRWHPRLRDTAPGSWLAGAASFLLAIALWLVPILVASQGDPLISAYRDEILFHQTVGRYTEAWHHQKPLWYFLVSVIPGLWLPLTLFFPWLIPKWRRAWHDGDLRVVLPLMWVVLVILFFSFSTGKRGVYVLPALPAFVVACAPYLAELVQKRVVSRWLYWLSASIAILCLAIAVFMIVQPDKRALMVDQYDLDVLWPLLAIGLAGMVAVLLATPRRSVLAYVGVLTSGLLVVSIWINPRMNDSSSGKSFIAKIQRLEDPTKDLGFVGFKEQYLLHVHRPVVHFGHARWREANQEAADAARWMSQDAGRQLLVNEEARKQCFSESESIALGLTNRARWFIVRGNPNPACVARGKDNVFKYAPPKG